LGAALMLIRACSCVLVLALGAGLLLGNGVHAQNRVHTETIKPPAASPPSPGTLFKSDGHVAARGEHAGTGAEIITDLMRLPLPVAQTRERILAAARSGNLEKLVAEMRASGTMPVFSFADDKDPVGYWKSNYPDSDGIEVLSILITILETGFVHVDVGTPQELYLWPYFARTPLESLTPEQKVELFKIVTGADYKDMVEFGAYSFYRLGISPDGVWHFFVSGD
jgi:hypothetical protein